MKQKQRWFRAAAVTVAIVAAVELTGRLTTAPGKVVEDPQGRNMNGYMPGRVAEYTAALLAQKK